MDRRFFTWLMLTTALCFLYLSMRPPLPVENQEARAPAEAANADPLLRDAGAGDGLPKAAAEDAVRDPQAEIEGDPKPVAIPKPSNVAKAITLGSMSPEKGYSLMVTLTTLGAGIEQAELVGQTGPGNFRYRALEHDGGYLGYLGLTETLTGLRVRTVPDGSPAALAMSKSPGITGGIRVGDVITELGSASLDSLGAMEQALSTTKPGETVRVNIQREGTPAPINFEAVLSEAPLSILRTNERSAEAVRGNSKIPSLRTTLGSINSTKIPSGKSSLPALSATLDMDWEVAPLDVPGGEGVEFRLPLESFLDGTGRPAKLDLVKRYRLLPVGPESDGFLLDLETLIVNRNDVEVNVSFRQEGLAGLTLEGWWYSVKISPFMFAGAGQRDVIFNTPVESHQLVTTRQINDLAKKNPKQPDKIILSESEPAEARQLKYIGLDAQYFNVSMLPHPDDLDSLSNLRQAGARAVAKPADIQKSQIQGTNVSFWFDTSEEAIAPGGQISQRYHIFAGPKDSEVLDRHLLGRAIEYGWFPWIAKPLSAILHFFHAIVHNYGLAIIMLTVMVRGGMFPLGRKAAMNAQRMQELQPELKKINDLYKDNMEKRAKAMQELYAKHNFKPLAGCLPMFIQLPIFIGLYRCLSVDVSLRQEPLIPGLSWCSNLAGPDMLFEWSSWMPEFIAGRGTGWLGPYFNILPMVTVGLFLLQQKMLMPKATDEQTRMTQNMMQVMTIFMGVLFFKVPSGLCIYFITSSLWSLVERKLVKRFSPPSSLAIGGTASIPTGTNNDAPNLRAAASRRNRNRNEPEEPAKPVGRLQSIVQMLEKPAVKSSTQRGTSKQSTRKDKKRRR